MTEGPPDKAQQKEAPNQAGTYAQPGDRIGAADDYPDLEADATAKAAAEADVNAGLDEEEDYIAIVRDESGQAPVTVSCGALVVDAE